MSLQCFHSISIFYYLFIFFCLQLEITLHTVRGYFAHCEGLLLMRVKNVHMMLYYQQPVCLLTVHIL